uniref:Uncharacterized protein n=1 Tax=Lotharella oceanica TaxID=641309 RepID=A0A7S2TT26_9EUKA|mmetsp:Transcript_26132/g.48719  ORF Transcript_26132/g.48719 Transcript_26132/m.48719 type:complete len:266 (+) Transcript_26132:45-842(+)
MDVLGIFFGVLTIVVLFLILCSLAFCVRYTIQHLKRMWRERRAQRARALTEVEEISGRRENTQGVGLADLRANLSQTEIGEGTEQNQSAKLAITTTRELQHTTSSQHHHHHHPHEDGYYSSDETVAIEVKMMPEEEGTQIKDEQEEDHAVRRDIATAAAAAGASPMDSRRAPPADAENDHHTARIRTDARARDDADDHKAAARDEYDQIGAAKEEQEQGQNQQQNQTIQREPMAGQHPDTEDYDGQPRRYFTQVPPVGNMRVIVV